MKRLLLLFAFMFLLVSVSATGSTQQYAKIYMNPLYRQSMDQDVNFTYQLTVDTPDGVSSVSNAMVTMQLWLNPTIEFFVWVDGQECNNPSYEVHTTYAGAGEGTIYFDCSNIITGEGVYTVTIQPDDDTGASTFWVDLTYSNDPVGEIEVFGTEYIYPVDTKSKMWLQLLRNNQSDFIDTAICHLTLYAPDNSVYFAPLTMAYLADGIYYHDFTTPTTEGVYPSAAECFYDAVVETENATGVTVVVGTVTSGFYTDTWTVNNVYHKIKEDKPVSSSHLDVVYDFAGLVQPPLNLTLGINFVWVGKWPSTAAGFDFLTFSFYNWTASDWQPMPNVAIPQSGLYTVSNTFDFPQGNLTELGFMDSTGLVRVKINDTDIVETANTLMQTDALNVEFQVAGVGVYQQVRGAGEVHVINGTRLTDTATWEYEPRNVSVDTSNLTVNVNETQVGNAVWNYNETISTSVISQFVNAFWAYIGSINANILESFSNQTWSENQSKYTYGIIIP